LACLIDGLAIATLSTTIMLLVQQLGFHHQMDPHKWLIFSLYCFCFAYADAITGSGLFLLPVFVLGTYFCVSYLSFWELGVYPFFAMLINWIYHVGFEASPGAATPGKKILSLRLALCEGGRPGVKRLTIRHALKSITMLCSCCVPLACLFICNRRQLIHDKVALTLVGPVTELQEVRGATTTGGNASERDIAIVGQPASILRRIVAAVIDGAVYSIGGAALTLSACALGARILPFLLADASYKVCLVSIVLLMLLSYSGSVLLITLGFALSEASSFQATPGKIVAGIRVTDLNGNALDFAQAFEKQLVQGLAYISVVFILCLVFAVAFAFRITFTQVPFAVIWYSLCYTIYGALVCVTFSRGQTVIDRLSGRMVVLDGPATTLSQRLSLDSKRKI
jgi:uncharacterized RDD family membrane protein YckC